MSAKQSRPSSVRSYYVFTSVVFGIGMVLSVAAESWSSFFIFTVLCATFVWVALRVDRGAEPPAGPASTRRQRPSARRKRRD